MSGLFRPLLLAAGCLATLCVMTAAQSTTLAQNETTPSVLPTTTTTTPVPPPTLPTVTTPAPGGLRPNGLSALARTPARPRGRAALPAGGARGAGAGRGPATWRPVRVRPGTGRGGRCWGSPRGEGAAEP